MMNTVYISVGTNIGNKVSNCRLAIKKIISISNSCKISSFYKTSSWGYEDDFFINFVVKITTSLNPNKLLKKLLFIENEMGRIRPTSGYSSRIIDFDILFFENKVLQKSNLVIPHPKYHLRNFVLVPLLEIAPDFVCPKFKITIKELVKQSTDKNTVEKLSIYLNL